MGYTTLKQALDELVAVNAEQAVLNQRKKQVEEAVVTLGQSEIQKQLADKDYGCGTATLLESNYKLKVVVSKKVSYDQEGLKTVAALLAARGENPEEYIKAKLDVSETAYKNWPSTLQGLFEPYRTVETSKPKLEVEVIA